MSSDAYARAMTRENKMWAPFVRSYRFDSGQTTIRATIFGLYSTSYLNLHGYLIEIEADNLAILLADYNAKIADLTNQEQIYVAEIVSKRYLAGIDKLIHDQKMVTKSTEISADDAMWDAKIAALEADQEALTTMSLKVTSETSKTAARITELQAYIGIEAVQYAEVEMEVAEKELQEAKIELEKLNAANAILKIQLDTLNSAMQLIEIDLQISRTKIDLAQLDVNSAKIDLLTSKLTISEAQTAISESELPIEAGKVLLAEAKSAELDAEKTYYDVTLPTQETEDYENKSRLLNLKYIIKTDELLQHKDEKDLANDRQLDISALEVTLANADASTQDSIDDIKIDLMNNDVYNNRAKVDVAIAVAEIVAASNISTTLIHTIKKQPET